MKLTTFLASSTLLALAACNGGGGDGNARFSDADAPHLSRAFEAASGVDYGLALSVGIGYSGAPTSAACPSVEHSGADTTVTGGCASADGTKYTGTVSIENAPLGSTSGGYDPTMPTVVTFDGFGIDDGTSPILLDGEVELARGSIITQLDATYGGIHARGDMTYTFDPVTQDTIASAGSTIDVDGVGSADVSGTWSFASEDQNGNVVPAHGSISLAGAETLVVDLAQQSASGCYATTIDGNAGTWVCPQ